MLFKRFELNKLNASTKEKLYQKLLNGILFADTDMMDLSGNNRDDLTDIDVRFCQNDLCLNSYYYNFYRRTNKAVKSERYKTFGQAIKQLKKLSKDMGYKIDQWRICDRIGKHVYTIHF